MSSGAWECGVCWAVYDPAEGDPVWQIPAGTPFEQLPEHWRCPRCDSPKEKFLARTPPLADRVTAAYRAAATRMEGLPVTNPRLSVRCSAFVTGGGGALGVVMTPWCLNALWVPDTASAKAGETLTRALPSGHYDFVVGELPGVGQVWALSLLSPVLEFADDAAAQVAVDAALQALLTPPAPEASAPPSRRALFGLPPTAP